MLIELLCDMKRILVLGAGRSSSALIRYLIEQAPAYEWKITVGDFSPDAARARTGDSPFATAVRFDIEQQEESRQAIADADIVVSLLPPKFHALVAKSCLSEGKHFLTASYVTDELLSFNEEAQRKGLLFLNECGLDPGIDHLSAMKVIDHIRLNGGAITSFESFTGGLIAPQTDPGNPWRYKFTWNPRNVVTAGQGTARYLQDGRSKYIPYQQVFQRITPVHVPGHGDYEGYANRDSLKYIDLYGLRGISTMLRGTLRHKGFCRAWNVFVQLGCCDDSYPMADVQHLTHAGFLDAFLPPAAGAGDIAGRLSAALGLTPDAPEIEMLRWSGFFDETPVGLPSGTPASILEHILNKRWALCPEDLDEIVMWHRFRYTHDGEDHEIQASLVTTGHDQVFTAMARTVGLPLAIATRLLAIGKIERRGVCIPTTREFYEPILAELSTLGIELKETQIR